MKSSLRRQPPRRRSERESRNLVQCEQHFSEQGREALLCSVQGALVGTAEQPVHDEVPEVIGAPWSRKGDSPLGRGGKTKTALTSLSDGLGSKKSAVCPAFQCASQKDQDALNDRPLGESTFVAVYIDGVSITDYTCIVARGVTTDGRRLILGPREGATENAAAVGDLLEEFVAHGVQLCLRTRELKQEVHMILVCPPVVISHGLGHPPR